MNILAHTAADDASDIFFYRPGLPAVDTRKKFRIRAEGNRLRVKNSKVNCLFRNLTADYFQDLYNEFRRHLNLDHEPAVVGNKKVGLDKAEIEVLTDTIITNWIYYYTINNLAVQVKREDFNHPYMVDWVLSMLDRKYGVDTVESLALGAKLLRQSLADYAKTVTGRRQYYDR
jgi:hypothetical protein